MNQENHSGDASVTQPLAGAGSLPLLTTKLYQPPITPDLEPRTRLVERLEQNRHRPLTLISAPAGYGKTILASLWLEANDCPSAWVSLDEMDNDLHTFTSYLLAAAMHTVFPSIEQKTLSLLAAPALPPAPVLARYLLNDLAQIPEPFILALDDVHLIEDQAVLDLLSELLHHPSQIMHLVLIGRRDPSLPIASLRALRQVIEIRALLVALPIGSPITVAGMIDVAFVGLASIIGVSPAITAGAVVSGPARSSARTGCPRRGCECIQIITIRGRKGYDRDYGNISVVKRSIVMVVVYSLIALLVITPQ